MKIKHQISRVLTGFALSVLAAPLAFAADEAEAWLNPLADGATSLSSQLVNIGGPVLGLCLAGYGIWSIFQANVDWRRVWGALIGGTLIGIGPSFATWFMSLLSGSGS